MWNDHPEAPPAGMLLCALDEIEDGTAKGIEFGDEKDPFRVVVIRHKDQVTAYVNGCRHFEGQPLEAGSKSFLLDELDGEEPGILCRVHYARYRISDGSCTFGECGGDGLTPIPVEVDDGYIQIARSG
ncbi:MAG: Rieske 2Fe-2S domain-containing protein [Magnetococcales bacterium]|nr:Rieske 2Fe-2S domain-containing protein [Magnetococcales bacterium]